MELAAKVAQAALSAFLPAYALLVEVKKAEEETIINVNDCDVFLILPIKLILLLSQ